MDPLSYKPKTNHGLNASLSSLGDYHLNSTNITRKFRSLEALSSPYQTFLVTLYSITALTAIIVNITGVLVLISSKRSTFKLKIYLLNLAIADILMSIFSTPFTYTDFMYGQWIFPPILCPIANFIQICTVCVSVYTLIAIGIER